MAEIQRRSRPQFVPQTRTRAIAVDTGAGSERRELLSQLGNFAQAVQGEQNRQLMAEIETNKVLGASRAAQDLMKSEQERQGITDDDTLAAKLSYNAIVGQHDTMKAGNQFAEWYQSNPDADDDTISAKKKELYQPLFEKYGSDEDSLKQISLQVQESQFSLVGVQDKIKANYTYQKHKEALGISIGDLMSAPNPDMDTILDSEIPARAKALGLTEFDMKKAIMEDAAVRASEGDARMLNKLEGVDWAKDSAALKKARSDYDRFVAREQSPAIGNAMADLEIEMLSLKVPWATTLRKIEGMNKQWPGTYTDNRVAELKKQRLKALEDANKVTSGINDSYRIYHDSSRFPLRDDPAYTDKDRKAIVKDLEQNWANKMRDMVANGKPADEARKEILKDQLKWSRLNRMKIPVLEAALSSAVNIPLDEVSAGGELPEYVRGSFDIIKEMDATAIELYLPGKGDSAFALNFKKFSESMGDDAAYRRADRIKRSPYKVRPELRQDQMSAVRTVAGEAFEAGFWESLLTDKKDVPDWQQEKLFNRLSEVAEQTLFNGGFDVTSNAEHATKLMMARSTQLFNGTLTNQPVTTIYEKISAGRDMPIDKTGDYIEAYMLQLQPFLEKAYGVPVSLEDVSLEFSRDGSSFTVLNRDNEQLGASFETSSIYSVGRNADLDDLRERIGMGAGRQDERVERERKRQERKEFIQRQHPEWEGGFIDFDFNN